MPSRHWFLCLYGAWLNVCLVSGCIVPAAGKSEFPSARDSFVVRENTTTPDSKQAVVAPVALEQPVEKPAAPPAPALEPPAPQPVEPAPAVQPPQAPQVPSKPDAVSDLRAYLSNQPVDTRELLGLLLPVVSSASEEEMRRGPAGVDFVLENINLLAETLRPSGSLTLNKICFTRNIESYGVYEPLTTSGESPVFQSGLDGRPGDRVQVYLEVRNFHSRQGGACWETALSSKLEISNVDHPGDGEVLMRRPARPDRSLSARQDYFLNIQFHIPPKLPPGRYRLRITVSDEIAAANGTKREDARTLNFRVEPPR